MMLLLLYQSRIIVFLILSTIVSSTAATPIPDLAEEPDSYFDDTALNAADDTAVDYSLFDSQQFGDQDGLAEAWNSNGIDTDTSFAQDFSSPDSSDLQAFLDDPTPTINPDNSEDSIYSAETCNAPINAQSSGSSNPLEARDLSDSFNLGLNDPEGKPSCKNPTSQPPPTPQLPSLQPEWIPSPVIDPINQYFCPREVDGIQPIALCCYDDDFGQLGDRIAVARGCVKCGFGNRSLMKPLADYIRLPNLDTEVLENDWKCPAERCCKVYHENVSKRLHQQHPNPDNQDTGMLISVLNP